jgi:hypothetical protein
VAHWPRPQVPEAKPYDDDRRVEADLAYREPKKRPPSILGPDDEAGQKLYDEAVEALARLFVVARESVTDPAKAPPTPHGSSPDRPIMKACPVRQSKPDSWSTNAAQVGDEVLTLAGRNPHRETLRVLNRGATALLVGPTPDLGRPFVVEAGATFSLDVLGPIYARSETGAVLDVRVTQTYYGETI